MRSNISRILPRLAQNILFLPHPCSSSIVSKLLEDVSENREETEEDFSLLPALATILSLMTNSPEKVPTSINGFIPCFYIDGESSDK